MTHQEAAQFLTEHDNYLILTHKRPDGDTIGCGVGLCHLLRKMGKTAWLLPSLDATALFREYLEGVEAPEGYTPDTVVSVDVATLGLLPPNAQPYVERIDLAIDHHPSQEFFAKETCLEADKAACGEILWEIAQDLGVMDETIATPLYVAVSTDTGCFVYANTTPHTHRVAAGLMEQGIDFKRLNKKHFRTKSVARMRLESLLLPGLYLCHDKTVAGGHSVPGRDGQGRSHQRRHRGHRRLCGSVGGTAPLRHHPGAEARGVQDLHAHQCRLPGRLRRVRPSGGRRTQGRRWLYRHGQRGGGQGRHFAGH